MFRVKVLTDCLARRHPSDPDFSVWAEPGVAGDAGLKLDVSCHRKYHNGMIVTIDRAGRVVVPKRLRDRFNLTAGTELEIKAAGDGLSLRRIGAEASLVRKHGILVHRGSTRVAIDVGEFIRAEREARSRRLLNEAD